MRSRIAKWVIPGVLTVLIGTAAATQISTPALEADLGTRADTALQSAELTWANVRFDGRDATLTGASPTLAQSDQAVEVLEQLPGVRVVNRTVEQAPIATPYPFVARINGNEISLSGGAPDAAARASLIEKAGLEDADLELLSGVENRPKWLAATDFALRQLRQFEEGEIRLSDMTLSMSGIAKSRESFETISIVLDAGLPSDVEIGDIEIIPPNETPYNWTAEYDGASVLVSGFTPDEQTTNVIENALPANLKLNLDLAFASGAPDNFASNTVALISAFARVSQGTAMISDGAISFAGTPLSGADADALTTQLTELDANIELVPINSDISEEIRSTVAENEFATPEMPALDVLSEPPTVSAPASVEAVVDDEGASTDQLEIEVVSPELPNLSALASPPAMPLEQEDVAAEPFESAPQEMAVEVEPATDGETIEAIDDLKVTSAENPTDQADQADEVASSPLQEPSQQEPSQQETSEQETSEQDSSQHETRQQAVMTPPPPNLTALSTPPQMPGSGAADSGFPAIAALSSEIANSPPPAVRASAVDLCRARLGNFETENSILFGPASTNFTEQSAEPLGRLANLLKQCPSAEVYVEGHTDSDGPENANLALSVSRAEAVVVELITRGVDASRLYAVGYGESVPLVSNNTRAGKSQNRRIEFEIPDSAE